MIVIDNVYANPPKDWAYHPLKDLHKQSSQQSYKR